MAKVRIIVQESYFSSYIVEVEGDDVPAQIDDAHQKYWAEDYFETIYEDDIGETGVIEIIEVHEDEYVPEEGYDLTKSDGEIIYSEYF